MARQAKNRPLGTNYQEYVYDYSNVDLSQFGGQTQTPQEDVGFGEKILSTGGAILEGLTFFPGGIRDTVVDATMGFDPNDTQEMARRERVQQEQQAYRKKYDGRAFEGVTDAMASMPYSLTTMGSALGAGALAAPAGPVAAGAAGMAASGTTAYRASVAEFERTLYGASMEALGRKPTNDEWGRINATFSDEATKYGLWEAGPEAISNLLMTKILGPLGSQFKGGLKGLIGKVAGLYGEELATETITQKGQGGIESDIGLRERAPGWGEAFSEVAPATFWQTTLMAGGKKGLDLTARRFGKREEDTGGPLIDEPAPAQSGGNIANTEAQLSDFGSLSGPEWNAPSLGFDEGAWNREAASRGWNHFRTDIQPKKADPFLSDEEYAEIRKFVQAQEAVKFSAALNSGETVDLLSWGGNEENPLYLMEALPQGQQRQALPMAGVAGALGLPPGSGTIPMGTAATGRPPIATPTEFAMPVVATPYSPRPALPQSTTQGLPQGQWAGGRSQLAYPYQRDPMQGMGFMGQAALPQAMPTQAQITSTQQAPRADTVAQAEALGMTAPEAMPVETRQVQAMAQPMVQSARPITPQVDPAWSYALPSFITAQHTVQKSGAASQVKTNRIDLINQLPSKSRGEARRMTNDQLQARIEAERNPVPFSSDTIGYTREDYPMPTAPSGTIFVSPSGRRMAPFPQVEYSTPRKRKASNTKVAQWLIDEAKNEAAPNEWRSLMLRDVRAENLPPATLDDLVDILTNGVQEEVIPQPLKTAPQEPTPAPATQVNVQKENNAAPKDNASPHNSELSEHFASQLLRGKKYGTIVQARKDAMEITGNKIAPGTEAVKDLDEAVELGVVKAAREIVSEMRKKNSSDVEIFRAMVGLYSRQPNLSSRTSTSIAMQAYSTPAPLAFLASHLAGVTSNSVVYEPTAGNGMLLIEANPAKAIVNELDPSRSKRLRSQGFTVTENDATVHAPGTIVDVVIANPPFGRVRGDEGQAKVWEVSGYKTMELDHAIALRALESLAERGRAVLIVGGKQGSDDTRSTKYQASMQRQFWRILFDSYKVVDHFTVDGKMYERQGAGYPVDFIVIDGKGRTEGRKFPAVSLPRVYENFEALEELIHEQLPTIQESMDALRGGRKSDDPGGSRSQGSEEPRRGVQLALPVGDAPAEEFRSRRGPRDGAGTVSSRDVQPRSGRGEAGGGELRADRHPADSGRQLSRTPEIGAASDRGGVSEQDGGRQRDAKVPARHEPERMGGRAEHSVPRKLVEQKAAAIVQKATEHQLPYNPRSQSTPMGTLVPRNMASPLKAALEKLEDARGDIDGYVAKELGYSLDELRKYFAGEQIDAIGLAIDNISRGSGFIIGDQTGIGKGRVNAAIIRYAQQKDLIPVFVTMKPDLYADMIRDLRDIGVTDFTPLPTNAALAGDKVIPLPGGGALRSGDAKKHAALLRKLADNDVQGYDAVFTTYDQLNPSKNEERRDFIRAIAPRALFILDESHNAGGSDSGKQRKKKDAKPVRAEFVREMLAASPHGAFYSSATYAKRPDVMSLYFKTDMRHAVDDIGMLAEAIAAGGIPLQQVVAAQLTESGQYIRRERSFEGASVEVTHAKAELHHAEQSSAIMRAIHAFDAVKQKALKDVKLDAMGDGDSVGDSSATGEKGANSTNFTSIMHNLIGQSLLAMKAQAAADEAAAAVERGEKPVLTLANTMGSFISEQVEKDGLSAGQELNLSFRDLFARYLEKTRTLTRRDAHGKVVESRLMSDEEIGASGVEAYEDAMSTINESSFGDLPISPIDFITSELERRGITVGEITGRTHAVEYRDGVPHYHPRKTSPAQNIDTMRRFNSGKLDAIILNQSGSTGISLHSSVTFEDQRKRTMIIVQPELNIDVFMQTLGRVFRTGQATPPAYKLLTSDIPAEKRPAAVLGKKMAGLNANTTASRKTDTTFQNIPDFLNVYGDVVTAQIMEEDLELHAALGNPLKNGESGLSREDAVRKVTGRIPMLPIKEQQALYERIETEYRGLIAQLEATGGSTLEAKTLPLDALMLESNELTPAKEGIDAQSPFAASSQLGLFDVKVLGKPYSPDQVQSMVAKGKEYAPEVATVTTEAREWLRTKMGATENDEMREKLRERTDAQHIRVREIIERFPVGLPVSLNTIDTSFSGVVTRVEFKGKGNPVAPSAWSMTVAVADAAKQLTIPFSKISTDSGGEIGVGGALVRRSGQSMQDVMAQFERGQTAKREKRYIAFGNVLAAYAAVGSGGQVVNFEDRDGNVRAGILFKKDADKSVILGSATVSFPDFAAVTKFFGATQSKGIVKTADGNMTISMADGQVRFVVPAAKAKGAQFYLNGKLIEAAGRDFVKTGNTMLVKADTDTAEKMIGVLREQGFGLVAGSHIEEARNVMGMEQDFPRASISPAQFLPQRKAGSGMRLRDVQRTVSALSGIARAAAPVQVVQSFEGLSVRLRKYFAEQAEGLEAVYDPQDGTVYFVADNLTSAERTAEVWMHEQVVHHGLRSLLAEGERKHLLHRLWESSGGMGNSDIADIAQRYGLRPTLTQADRNIVMEEYLAMLAEKKKMECWSLRVTRACGNVLWMPWSKCGASWWQRP